MTRPTTGHSGFHRWDAQIIISHAMLVAFAMTCTGGCHAPARPSSPSASCDKIAEAPLKAGFLSPYGELPAKYVYTAHVEEAATLIEEGWTTIIQDGAGDFILDQAAVDPKKSLLLFAPERLVKIKSPVKARNIVLFAGDLDLGANAFLDVSAPRTNPGPAEKPPTPTGPGSHGQFGAAGAPGADGGMLVLLLKRDNDLKRTLPGVARFADLSGQPGQTGQPGGDGAPGFDKSGAGNDSTCGTYYSSTWDFISYQRGLEECRGATGGPGGNAGLGGAGGPGGSAGLLYLLGATSGSTKDIQARIVATPGKGGAAGPHGQPALGGPGAPGRLINERHCWERLLWTDCETRDRHHRGYTGNRGPSGIAGSSPSANGQDGRPFTYPPPAAGSSPAAIGPATSWSTPLLEHMENRVIRLSETGLHQQAEVAVGNAIEFAHQVSTSTHAGTLTVRDARAVGSLYRLRDSLRSGLSANGEMRELPNHLPLFDTKELADGLRFEASTFARRRELYEILRTADIATMSSAATLKKIDEQLQASEREITIRFETLGELTAKLKAARLEYDRAVLKLDAEFEAHYGKRIAALSAEEWKKFVGNKNAELLQGAGALAALAITVFSEGALAPVAATLVSYGTSVAARKMRDESLFKLDDIATVAAGFTELLAYNSGGARADREKLRDTFEKEKKALKRAKLILDYANADRRKLERDIDKIKQSTQAALTNVKALTGAMANTRDLDPAVRRSAEALGEIVAELERLRAETALNVNEISRLSELTLWLETVRGEDSDDQAQSVARRFAADQLWQIDLVKSTRIRRAMNAHRSYIFGRQPKLLEGSWNQDELEYVKLIEAMEALLPSSRVLEEVHSATLQDTISVKVPWRSTPKAEYEIRIGQDVGVKLATVRCIRIDGLGDVSATISHGADHWLQSNDDKFAHYTMPSRSLGRFTSAQQRICFSESLLRPALIGSWSLVLRGVNESHACKQAPLVVHFETIGH